MDSLFDWAYAHRRSFRDALKRLMLSPISGLMTITMIAVAVALPLLLFKTVTDLSLVVDDWKYQSELSVFLNTEKLKDSNGATIDPVELGHIIMQFPVVEDIQYVSPEESAAEFFDSVGLSKVADALPESSIPPLLRVHPYGSVDQKNLEDLVAKLNDINGVEQIVYDQQWLQRFNAILDVIQQVVFILGFVMGLGVVLVISNYVRAAMSMRALEIEVIILVGGTSSFIRRPFFYTSAILCLVGVLLSWLITNLVIWYLSGPIQRVAEQYSATVVIKWIGWDVIMVAVAICLLLGVGATRISVDSHLRLLKPR